MMMQTPVARMQRRHWGTNTYGGCSFCVFRAISPSNLNIYSMPGPVIDILSGGCQSPQVLMLSSPGVRSLSRCVVVNIFLHRVSVVSSTCNVQQNKGAYIMETLKPEEMTLTQEDWARMWATAWLAEDDYQNTLEKDPLEGFKKALEKWGDPRLDEMQSSGTIRLCNLDDIDK